MNIQELRAACANMKEQVDDLRTELKELDRILAEHDLGQGGLATERATLNALLKYLRASRARAVISLDKNIYVLEQAVAG